MLLDGVRLMVVGMTTVFAFLGVLVVAMQATRVVVESVLGVSAEPPAPERRPEAQRDDRDIAVVLAAVRAARGGR